MIRLGTPPFLIVGLGNPGLVYERTRHNAGFLALSALAGSLNVPESYRRRGKAKVMEVKCGNKKLVLARPETFMNESGRAVSELRSWYKCPDANIIIIYDDVDLPLGRIRVRPSGGAGTHNGMRSIAAQTQSGDFPRVRIGIGPQPTDRDIADFVLERMGEENFKLLTESAERAAEAALAIVDKGVQEAMNGFNRG